MAETEMANANRSQTAWVSNPTASRILNYLQIAYPIVLLVLYLTTFTVRSVVTARSDHDTHQQPEQLGPGGKPLPKKKHTTPKKESEITPDLDFARPRKLLFEWLSVGVVLSLSANILVVVVHAISARHEGWWCGQAPTVCLCVGASRRPPCTAAMAATYMLTQQIDLLGGLLHGLHTTHHPHDRIEALAHPGALCDMGYRNPHGDHSAGSLVRRVHL